MYTCIGFVWQGFGRGGATEVAAVRCQKLLPYLIEPVPIGSKRDPPLAKAETISNSGSPSVTTYLRKGKNW